MKRVIFTGITCLVTGCASYQMPPQVSADQAREMTCDQLAAEDAISAQVEAQHAKERSRFHPASAAANVLTDSDIGGDNFSEQILMQRQAIIRNAKASKGCPPAPPTAVS